MATQSRPSPGDFTGKQKQSQAKEAVQDRRDRAAEMSMITAIEEDEKAGGVFDPKSGELLEGGSGLEEVDNGGFPQSGFAFNPRPQEQVFTGKESESEMEPHLASSAPAPAPVFTATIASPMVKIRTNCDIEDMTYGMINGEPNNFTFREGYTYEVSRDVAEHLNQRSLIAQWVS